MTLRKILGSAIKEARVTEGISRSELAVRCNLKTSFIKLIEDGEFDESLIFYDRIFSNLKLGNQYRFVRVDYREFFKHTVCKKQKR